MPDNRPFPTLHVNMEDFLPATEEEKRYIVQMRPSSTFFRDGVNRLLKNKVATLSFIVIVAITVLSIVIPLFWPYSYDNMLGVQPGRPVDPSYNNLAPFAYGATIDECRRMMENFTIIQRPKETRDNEQDKRTTQPRRRADRVPRQPGSKGADGAGGGGRGGRNGQ